jgi:hypothetical protein
MDELPNNTLFSAVGNITDTRGYIWAVTPGNNDLYLMHCHLVSILSGFQASCTPRCGDASCSAQQHGMVQRHGLNGNGFESVYAGTPDISTMRIVDYGYVYSDRNTTAANRRTGNQDVPTVTDQVDTITTVFMSSKQQAAQTRKSNNSVLSVELGADVPVHCRD